MLSKIFDSFGTFAPKFLKTMVTKENSVGQEAINSINEQVKSYGVPTVSTDKVEGKED